MIELAKLQDGQLVYGLYEEVEKYAEEQDTCVDRYFDHINPSTVYKNFKYVGNDMSNVYKVSVPFDYSKGKPPATFNDAGVNQDKW
jgi:tagatose-1,6-bisphosphate aldolase